VIERLPPPQLFSDENPNACCISWSSNNIDNQTLLWLWRA
jgi:hypothetical protein